MVSVRSFVSRRRLVPLLVAGALALGVWGVAAAQEAKEIAGKLAALREAAADRNLDEAERRLQELLAAQPGPDTRDEGFLLAGKTRLLAGRAAEAADVVRPVVDRTESPWHVKALYLTAEAAARRRSWGQAAEVYAKRVEWASSDLHKAEIAALYREIADGAFEGDTVRDEFGREKRVPDWAAARDFYAKTLATHVEAKDFPIVKWRLGHAQLNAGDPAAALATWNELLATGAADFTDDTLYGIGLAQMRLGRNLEARATLERLRAEHGDSPFAALALLRIGESHQAGGKRSPEDLMRTVTPWREFLRLHPSHEQAADVHWMIANELEANGDPRAAADALRDFLAKFPEHARGAEAQDRIARAHLALGEFDRAIAEWQTLLTRWPNSSQWGGARQGIVDAAFRKGRVAYDEKRYDDARAAFDAFLAAHPADPLAPEAQFLLGELLAKDGKHAEAVAAWRLAAQKHPGSLWAAEAMFRVAQTYEGPLADLEKSLAAYEEVAAKWPGTEAAARARGVLVQMKGKTLEFTVARPFRTDEELALPVRVRNVTKLRMKAYRVRLEDYARRKGGLDGVGDVVVDVVKPDHEWDWSVPEYGKYRLLDRTCPLTIGKPGAFIVTAAEEELTATFLVIVSDLTVIAKSAASQALVFVYDERTGKTVRGARIALLDGGEGLTGEDGVWRKDDAASQVRAVVVGQGEHKGHYAFAGTAAQGATAFGYTTKAFVWTERPVYRPGQTARLRAIVRRVADGRYVTEKGLSVFATVTDPRGATLLEEELFTDEFGFVAADLPFAAEPSLGAYTFKVSVDTHAFTAPFDVLAYKKPDVLADVVPEKRAYLAGDTVKAKASLRYTVGGNVAAAPVRWTVVRGPFAFDASVHEAFAWFFRDAQRDAEQARLAAEVGEEVWTRGEGVTDGEGRFEFSFATEPLEQDRTYAIVFEAQDPNRRWIRASASIPVTSRGVHVICRTEKKVYRPGESLKLEVTTVDPLHVPLALEGRAVLLRRRLQDQHFVDDVVAEAPAKTGEDGRATVELKAAKPGEHVLRFIAKDAKGRDVVGETTVTVAGDAEDLAKQARLVADREFYREGDVAKVFVNVPVAPVPVLLTWEGERVLEHRVVMATERASTIEMPLRTEHAPNVFLRMAAAKGGVLHEDGDEVAVFQYLDVKVEADPPVAKPGGKVRLSVVATDQSGRPVKAQVGIDVIDAAILQIAPDRTPQIKPFFYDQRRTHGVRTGSSASALPSLTRPTNKDLLFEQMRRLGKAQWEAMQEHVRQGREALQRGDAETAKAELRKALEIAPGNYEARMLLDNVAERDRAVADKKAAPPAASPKPGAAEGTEKSAFASRRAGGGGRGGGGKLKDSARAKGEQDDASEAAEDGAFNPSPEVIAGLPSGATGGAALGAGSADANVMLAQGGPVLVPAELRQRFEDTAYSSPSVRTNAEGRATIEIDLPDNLSEWKVTARGAGAGPLVGEGGTLFRAAKKLLVRPDAPRFLTQGDWTTPTGTVHSSLDEAHEVTIRFAADGAKVTGLAELKAQLGPGAVQPFDARLESPDHGLGRFRVEALTTVESDAAEIGLPLLPWGLRRLDGASGTLVEEAYCDLDLPEKTVPGTVRVTVTLSPSIDVSLLEAMAYTGGYPWGCVEQTVNRFLPALAARNALGATGSDAERLKARLDDAVRRGLAALYAMQNDDGSFGWFGARSVGDAATGRGDPEMTAYAVIAMVRAEHAGFKVSASNRGRAVNAAKALVRGGSLDDRAFVLYALSFANQAELEPLNALFRDRAQLSPRALALLALTMQRTGRPSNALELLRTLETKAVRKDGTATWDMRGGVAKDARIARPVRDAEPTAYALLAFLAGEPTNPLVDEAAAWLISSRRGPAWRSTRDTAAAIEALAEHAKSRGVERAQGDVAVYLNDDAEPVATMKFGGPGVKPVDAPSVVVLPDAKIRPGRNKVILRRKGAGRIHWTALASAVEVPGEKGIEAGGVLLRVSREYTEFVRPPLPGEKPEDRILPGWSIVASDKRPAWTGRPLALAGTGDKVRVTLRVHLPEGMEHLLVEDPLPAGFEVVTGSAEGSFDREERRDDRQAFFVSRAHGTLVLSYVIQAIHPGEYRALPAQARLMYEPEIHAWSAPAKMTVSRDPGAVRARPQGEEVTPDEVWGLALRAFARKDFASARQMIEELLQKHTLRPDVQEEAWARLFAIGVELNDAKLIVQAYEQMTDRNPRRAPSGVRERRALAEAYRSLGEHERATVLLRDLVRDLAQQDFEAARSFDRIGNPWRTRRLVLDALRRLPDAAWTDEIEMQVARQTMDLRAASAGTESSRRPVSSDAHPFLLEEAVRMFRAFQAHRADSPLAHEAGRLSVEALLRMKLDRDAVAEGARFLTRHPSSPHLDDVTLLVAIGHFQAGDYDRALATAKRLLEGTFPVHGALKNPEVSPFRNQAIHIAAKVAHVRGDLARAVDLYRQVSGLFPDAADALGFLTQTGLELREVESVAVGETARIHLRRRNVPEVDLEVYAVDFMILYAMKRNLAEVNRIDLSGIEPVKRWSVKRRGPEDFQWSEEEIDLPAKEKGVYLVVARSPGSALEASSIVLVSDLAVSVQEAGGRLRVYTTHRKTGAPAGEVYVKVGNGASIQAQGFTDARGVFEAPAVPGAFSVVAEKDGNVALWRR